MFVAVLFAGLIANGVSAEHVRVLAETGNGEKIPIDITMGDGFVITVSGQPDPPQPFFKQSINLYDFDQHMEARKVTEEDTCYIRVFKVSYDEMQKVVNAAKSNSINSKMTTEASEEWNIPGNEIKDGELNATVGARIAEFCSGYKVFWVNQDKKVINLQVRLAKRLLRSSDKGRRRPGSGFSANGRVSNGRGFNANVGGRGKPGRRPSLKGRMKNNNGRGSSAKMGGRRKPDSRPSLNGRLKNNNGRESSANLGGRQEPGNRPSLNGRLNYNNGRGSSANLGGTRHHRESSVNGGPENKNGKELIAHAGGSETQGSGGTLNHRGSSVNSGLENSNGEELVANAGGSETQGSGGTLNHQGPSVNSGLENNNGEELIAHAGGSETQGSGGTLNHWGSSVNSGLENNNGDELITNAGGAETQESGFSASAGLKWTFAF